MMNYSTMSSVEGEDESEESASSSPLANMPNQFRSVLDDFREQWQKELKAEPTTIDCDGDASQENGYDRRKVPSPRTAELNNDVESQAERLFLEGAELEKRGKVYDALNCYRRAVQIVPDIEFRIYEAAKKAQTPGSGSGTVDGERSSNDDLSDEANESDEDLSNVDLYVRFQNAILKGNRLFSRANAERGTLLTGAHLSDLPMEIILSILRWVVSAQLDFRSLEQCAAVCKGFYLCARDEEIWRLACLKVWGVNTGILENSGYKAWREMYIFRQRVHFHGCYISKTSYMRYGENSFQDQFYRPFHIVEYYRYIRFFPGGIVLMMTSADDPAQTVGKLRYATTNRPEILKGHFRLHGDQVIIVLKRLQKVQNYGSGGGGGGKKRSGASDAGDFDTTHTFFIELKVAGTTKRKFNQLIWTRYSFLQAKKQNNRENEIDFELTSAKYPPFWFSRVKSYHSETDAPLQ